MEDIDLEPNSFSMIINSRIKNLELRLDHISPNKDKYLTHISTKKDSYGTMSYHIEKDGEMLWVGKVELDTYLEENKKRIGGMLLFLPEKDGGLDNV